jgi:predicted phage terminase large subunit-like protein
MGQTVRMSILAELLKVDPAEVATWPEPERRWYEAQLRRELALRSPADFAVTHSEGQWQPYRHLQVTSDAVVGMVEQDECDLLLVDEPVRHGKSQLCSKWVPAWYLCKHEGRRSVLLGSYEADFAEKWGRATRGIMNEIGAEYGLAVSGQSKAASRWELVTADTGKLTGGGMNTAGANGPITGKGGHLLILDDPIKNSEQANSATERQKLKDWWDTTWITRREGGGTGTKYLLIMSRWHVDDLMGWLLKREDELGMRIKRLRMPAIAEDDDMLGRRPGEALCPELFDEQALAGIKKDSPVAWPSLYQQRPIPIGGGMFKRDDFKTYMRTTVGGEQYFQLGERLVAQDECLIFGTMDTAYTKSKRSDYTALGIWAVSNHDPSDLLLLHMYRLRAEHAEHAPLLIDAWRTYKPRWIGIEKISATLALFAEAQRQGVVMRWLTPDKNKVARAETAVAMTQQHRVWLPEEADMAEFIEECVSFPSAAHDDMVDVFAYAAGEVYKRAARGHRRKRHEPETMEERVWEKVRKMHTQDPRHPVLGNWR